MVFGGSVPLWFSEGGTSRGGTSPRARERTRGEVPFIMAFMFTYCSQRAFKGCWLDGMPRPVTAA